MPTLLGKIMACFIMAGEIMGGEKYGGISRKPPIFPVHNFTCDFPKFQENLLVFAIFSCDHLRYFVNY